MSATLSDLLAAGVSLFGQGSRLLKLRFSESSNIPPEALLPHRLHGEEGLSQNYRYTLDCLSADTHLELKTFLGQPIEISLLLPDGGHRLLTGIVTSAAHAGADGGFAKYILTIEPALATLTHRRNSRVFQDQSVPQIVSTLLDEHLASNPAFTGAFQYRDLLTKTYPVRSYCLQYRESDLTFITRLLAEEGISYRYTHGPDPETSLRHGNGETGEQDASNDDQASETNTDIPQHSLILFDDNSVLRESRPAAADNDRLSTASNTLRFHRTDGIESDDAIDAWTAARVIQPGRTTLTSYDYQSVTTHRGDEATRTDHGQTGTSLTEGLPDYDPQTAYYGDPDDLARYTQLRQQAKDLAGKSFQGGGTARHLVPGTWFELQDHPIHDQDNPEDRQFLVTSLSFDAQNNLTPEARQGLGSLLTSATEVSGKNNLGKAATQSTPPTATRSPPSAVTSPSFLITATPPTRNRPPKD